MKNKILFYIGLLLIPFLNSCEEEGINTKQPPLYEATWADEATLIFTPSGDGTGQFEYYIEFGTGGQRYFNITDVDYDVTVDIGEFPIENISKVDIYAFVEEENGTTYNYLGGDEGKLFTTINNPSQSFQFTMSVDDIETLFGNDFSADHNGALLPSDIIEFKWVLTDTEGNVFDSRSECVGFNCTYGFGTKVVQIAPPIWEGTFNYEWIDATADAIYYGGISIGQTGTITMTLQPGSFTVYDVSHLTCDYYYGGPGVLDYNYETGEVNIIDSSWRAQAWNIIDVSGPTITVEFSYYYSAPYNEYGTFTLTRTDGQDWPTNIHTN